MDNKTRLSIRTFFLLAMCLLILLLALPQFLSGSRLLNTIIHELGTELIEERLAALIQPVDRRYDTLRRVGLEDSSTHLEEIRKTALAAFAETRYKQTGTMFVIGADRTILLSTDFTGSSDPAFAPFFTRLTAAGGNGIIEYTVRDGRSKLAACRYYPPWQCYIGLSIDRDELFGAHNKFIKINIQVLAGAIVLAFLCILAMQRLIITPILRLTRFAEKVTQGDYQPVVQGPFILELKALKNDVTTMVGTLRRQMLETERQLAVIRERETERDLALEELRESENRYRAIYNAPSDAIFIHDALTGQLLDVNQTMLQMYGYSREEALRLSIEEISAGDPLVSRQESAHNIRNAMEQGPQVFTWHARRKNGELFWVEMALKYTRFNDRQLVISVVRDITDRKRAEDALAAEKERLAVTLRSIGDGVITTDTRGRVVMLNKVAEELTGWSQEQAAGAALLEVFRIINDKTGQPCDNPVDKVLDSGNIVGLANHTVLIARDGTQRHIADSGAPIRDPASRIIGVVLVFRDVTEKLRYEQEILKIKKLESVAVLAGGIAHDFNNILAAILGNINLARIHVDNGTDAATLLEEAEKASLRARSLTQQLLTFAKGGAPVRQICSIAGIVRESASFVLRGSNVNCTFDIPEDLWLVDIDEGQMGQVIQNIIINARQAMPQGGTVSIRCRNRTGSFADQAGDGQEAVEITISDTGTGIPENYLDRIFDPYFSSKQQGSGLGLAICHSIIRNHDGHIGVISTPGEGATFTITLPACRKQPAAAKPEHAVALPAMQARVLVMDDEEIIRNMLESMLKHINYQVVLTENGEEALARYQAAHRAGEPIDVVIMDLTIRGGMGGQEAAGKILEIDPAARIIVSSGYSNDPIMASYRDYGFCAAISKPFQLQDLLRVLQQALVPEGQPPASPRKQ
jgi:PAS domain S-box-containing protein